MYICYFFSPLRNAYLLSDLNTLSPFWVAIAMKRRTSAAFITADSQVHIACRAYNVHPLSAGCPLHKVAPWHLVLFQFSVPSHHLVLGSGCAARNLCSWFRSCRLQGLMLVESLVFTVIGFLPIVVSRDSHCIL